MKILFYYAILVAAVCVAWALACHSAGAPLWAYPVGGLFIGYLVGRYVWEEC